MLRWALNGADAGKVTTTGNAAHNLSAVYETGKVTVEGKVDRINNVYDLEGNGREMTAEARGNSNRGPRGGYYRNSYAPSSHDYTSTYFSYYMCSRLVLYIM